MRQAVAGKLRVCGFRATGKQTRQRHIVGTHGLANFCEHLARRLVVERLAKSLPFELMRKDAQQVKIAPRAHHFRGFAQNLNFAGGVCDRAVFFVSRRGGKNDIGCLGGFRQKHFLHNEQIELAAPIAGVSKVHQRICTHHVQRLQLSRPSRFHHLRRSESRLRRKHRAPKLFESFAGLCVVHVSIPGQAVGQQSHVRRAAGIAVIAECHVAALAGQL